MEDIINSNHLLSFELYSWQNHSNWYQTSFIELGQYDNLLGGKYLLD